MNRKTRNLLVLAILLAVTVFGYLFYPPARTVYGAPVRAKEAVLRTNLHTLRDVIQQFNQDRHRYPSSLDELVEAGYLRKLPSDPFTRSDRTWQPTREPRPYSGTLPGIVDVHSGAPGKATSGIELAKL